MKLLKDKVVLVTGGAQGIGRECSLTYIREGATVAVLDNDSAAVERMTTELGESGLATVCDVSSDDSVRPSIRLVLGEEPGCGCDLKAEN